MIKNLFTILSALVLLSSCTNFNEIDDQRTEIIDYLEDLGVEYEVFGNAFRYTIVNDTIDNSQTAYITNNSEFSIYFEAYTFESSPGTLYFTNIEETAAASLDGLNTEFWSFEPLEIVLGKTDILEGLERTLEGCKYGDSLNVFMCSDLAYGEMGTGIVPKNTAVVYVIKILDQQ